MSFSSVDLFQTDRVATKISLDVSTEILSVNRVCRRKFRDIARNYDLATRNFDRRKPGSEFAAERQTFIKT